jgi:tRNA1(Val) A37 N6-methylase TrmN6
VIEVDESAITRDAFLDGRLMLMQPARGYRAGIDAVFLAATAQPQEGRAGLKILDAGSGVGTVGLLAACRLCTLVDVHVTLIERNPELAALAERNARQNDLAERTRVICADFLGSAADLEAAGVARESFDLILTNPPYHVDARGTQSDNAVKARAHAMGECDLDRWVRVMARLTRPGGEVVLVHKADALTEVLAALSPRFGALRVMPLYPRDGEPASRILVMGVKGSRALLTLLPGAPLHNDGNDFHPGARQILRDGAGLWLRATPPTSDARRSEPN